MLYEVITWLVPHFEKMTYDNALLSQLYLKAHHVTNDPFYKNVAFETIDFMLSKMSENNLFYSASDADSDGEEGSYFIYGYEEAIMLFDKAGIVITSYSIHYTKLYEDNCAAVFHFEAL